MRVRARAAALLSLIPAWLVGAAWLNGFVGCGGNNASSGVAQRGDDGGSDGAGLPGDGQGGDDGGTRADGSIDAGAGCLLLRDEIARLRPAAKACTVGAPNQCGVLVTDECCEISVTDESSDAVKKLVDAVNDFHAHCRLLCPMALCSTEPSKTCLRTDAGDGICSDGEG